MKKYCIILVIILIFNLICLNVGMAEENSAYMMQIYVSVSGNDENDGTAEKPFKSLERAQAEVRKNNDNMSGDILVEIGEGTYCLENTLLFTEEDSGSNGYKIIWNGASEGESVISGGITVDNWQDNGDGTWSATVGDDIEEVRDLYINGEKRSIAKVDKKIRAQSFYTKENSAYDYDGIVVDRSLVEGLENPGDVVIHSGSGWMCHVVPMEEIIILNEEQAALVFKQPMFNYITPKGGTTNAYGATYAMKLENAKIYLNQPGEYYYDKGMKKIYYIPKEGEKIDDIVANIPKLQDVITISGSDTANKVENIRFENITFAYGSWNLPYTDGYSSVQAQWVVLQDAESTFTPANITVKSAKNIDFYNNVFRGMGCVALGIHNATDSINVVGNAFYDCKDSAVSIGLTAHSDMEPVDEYYDAAYEKNVWASSEARLSRVASRATDYLLESGWAPSKDDEKPWITVDLGEKTRVDGITVYLASGGLESQSVLMSNDKDFKEYTTAKLSSSSPSNDVGAFKVKFSGTYYNFDARENKEYQYVRLMVNKGSVVNRIKVFDHSRAGVAREEVCKNTLLKNNYITRVADYFWSSPAVTAYYVEKAEITQNHMQDLPYTGVSLGWGWDSWLPYAFAGKENKVTNNYFENLMTENFDGGAIYTIGRNTNSFITGNYINECRLPFGAIYLDTASTGFTVEGNAIENVGRYFFANPNYETRLENNYATTDLGTEIAGSINPVEVFAPGKPTKEIKKIMDDAGLEDEYLYLLEKVPGVDETYNEFGKEGYLNVLDQMGPSGVNSNLLGREITSAAAFLEKIEQGDSIGDFSQEAIDRYKEVYWKSVGVSKTVDHTTTGESIYSVWKELTEAYTELYESRNKMSYDELYSIASAELNNATEGDMFGQYSKDALGRMNNFMNGPEYYKNLDEYTALEQAYLMFNEERNVLGIKDIDFQGKVRKNVIDEKNGIIYLYAEPITNLKNLKVKYTLEDGLTLSKQSQEIVDYSKPVYIVVKNASETDYRFWKVIVNTVTTE